MPRKGKQLVWQNWQTAYETIWRGLVELDAPISETDGILKIDSMESKDSNPEEMLIKKEAYLSLSEEAKEVINLTLNSPQEILDCFYNPKYNTMSKEKIKRFLLVKQSADPFIKKLNRPTLGQTKRKKWTADRINRYFEELKRFTMEFE